ncbi:MAG TPA: universal stress protein, partial [bacterium]|nr:universal stress protein [bacterium]
LQADLKKRGVSANGILLKGDPSSAILEQAAKGYDLIVIGTHGRRGIQRLLLGSVAERVVRAAPCAVLTVKGARAGGE